MSAQLSVNVNKVALLRNSRGRDVPNVLNAIDLCLASGCHGITIHPRRDQRHIRYDDVPRIAAHLADAHPGVELNIECELHPELMELVLSARPAQCTLVPVTPGEITSDHGWTLPRDHDALATDIARLKAAGIRTSMFMDVEPAGMALAARTGVDRVELYTGPYAWAYGTPDEAKETKAMARTAEAARAAGLGVNAGHDLDRHNLGALRGMAIDEVSIGHAVITRALEVGLPTAIQELLTALGHA